MLTEAISELIETWKDEAKLLHRRGAQEQAVALESCVCDLDAYAMDYDNDVLTIEEATEDSGYDASSLYRQIKEGKIPNAGSPGSPRLLRKHLPRKPGSSIEGPTALSVPDILEDISGALEVAERHS